MLVDRTNRWRGPPMITSMTTPGALLASPQASGCCSAFSSAAASSSGDERESRHGGGWAFSALRNIAVTLLATGRTRLELLSNELEEESSVPSGC